MSYKQELLKQLWAAERQAPTTTIQRPTDTLVPLQKYVRRKQEEFIVITLDGSHNIIRIRSVTKGLVNRAMVHAREVFRPAILDNAVAIIVAHNHPSGGVQPSEEDNLVTKLLQHAGDAIGIKVLDHLIISKDGYYSYLESNKL